MVTVLVAYEIEVITKVGTKVEVQYQLTNTSAPLTREYREIFDFNSLYSGVGDTDINSDRKTSIDNNFLSLATSNLTSFADEARLLIIEGIGKTIGVGITGVSSFVYNPIVSKGLDPNTCFVTWLNKAGI
jgi:hypothetical protein